MALAETNILIFDILDKRILITFLVGRLVGLVNQYND